ncbi:MAG: alpha amylase C-terminal domain-containing protein [Planctomycetota bacterium]
MGVPNSPTDPDGTGLIALDPWLEPFADALRQRFGNYQRILQTIHAQEGSLDSFSRGYEYFGFNRGTHENHPGVWYREWAPGAQRLALIGDFNDWDRGAHPLERNQFGVWSTFLPDDEYADRLVHEGRVKVHVVSQQGRRDHIPAYIRRVTYGPHGTQFTGQYWCPPTPFEWRHVSPGIQGSPRIYEAHVGMAQEEPRVGTYREFSDKVLPRIADAGYNAVQLMAIQEHPYYGSFGYQVSNFFAPTSRCGTPEDLKALIDAAHGHGLLVLLDLVHSHAVKNVLEGLNQLDGTGHLYFHAGERGQHVAWDSCLFDYGKWEVVRFLLSNARFWLEEYHFDGFRFDGVTSMLYHDHGLGRPFDSYAEYFPPRVDNDALVYLQLVNHLVHELKPAAITIAEDVSGMVGIARPLAEGGLGFDYRLAMGIPDYWIRLLKEKADEQWPLGELYRVLTDRRAGEKHVTYAESHDQSLVGDQTLAFRLMDADMYADMNKGSQNPVIERGIALHKIIRLLTYTLGGEAYLNFMGNEFGHPEWVDFPRSGNNFSHKYARRQWSLVDDQLLRYRDLAAFDRALMALDKKYDVLSAPRSELLHCDEDQKIMVYVRGGLIFAFNFHSSRSYPDYRCGVPVPADYRLVLNSDDLWFGGHAIVDVGQVYPWQDVPCHGSVHSIQIYLPARTAQVLEPLAARP